MSDLEIALLILFTSLLTVFCWLMVERVRRKEPRPSFCPLCGKRLEYGSWKVTEYSTETGLPCQWGRYAYCPTQRPGNGKLYPPPLWPDLMDGLPVGAKASHYDNVQETRRRPSEELVRCGHDDYLMITTGGGMDGRVCAVCGQVVWVDGKITVDEWR